MGQVDKLVVRSPEKAGVGGSTPSLATILFKYLRIAGSSGFGFIRVQFTSCTAPPLFAARAVAIRAAII